MLRGKTIHPMDAKGRVSLPAKHRKALSEELIAVKSPQQGFPSLRIYSAVEFDAWAERMIAAKGWEDDDPRLDILEAEIYSETCELTFDQAGRVLIPAYLRQECHLEKSVVIRGAGNRSEIWDPQVLADFMAENQVSIFSNPQ
jgi:MraZ protein